MMKTQPFDRLKQKLLHQGASHMQVIDVGCIRVWRKQHDAWQVRMIYAEDIGSHLAWWADHWHAARIHHDEDVAALPRLPLS